MNFYPFALACGALLAWVCAAFAGDIPKGYRGRYAGEGVKLELKEDQALFDYAGQTTKLEVVREPAAKLFSSLSKGRAGLYIEEPAKGVFTLQAFGALAPDSAPLAAGGFVWRRSPLLYFTLNREQLVPATELNLTWADDGLLTLDSQTNGWQFGWGPNPRRFLLRRADPLK
jgi:hypothetical protein